MNDIRLTTPKGYAQYPYLNPDTKFNPEGDYKVNLAMDDNEATGKLIAKLQQILEDFYDNDEEVAKAVAKGRKVVMSDIYENDEEGRIVLKFKQKAKITKKNGERSISSSRSLTPVVSLWKRLTLVVILLSRSTSLFARTIFRLLRPAGCLSALWQFR